MFTCFSEVGLFLRSVVASYSFLWIWMNACVFIFGCLRSCACLKFYRLKKCRPRFRAVDRRRPRLQFSGAPLKLFCFKKSITIVFECLTAKGWGFDILAFPWNFFISNRHHSRLQVLDHRRLRLWYSGAPLKLFYFEKAPPSPLSASLPKVEASIF
jgi:hypothetical protein